MADRKNACALAACAAMTLLAACSKPEEAPRKPLAVATVDPATSGTLDIDVRYEGPLPELKTIDMRGVPRCADMHPEPAYDASLVVKDGRLANAIVWIKEGLEGRGFAPPAEPVVVDQEGCLFRPRVAAAMVGQAVEFRNSDPEPHNVRSRPRIVRSWNFMIARRGANKLLTFDKAEVAVPIGCDIHPWMRAYLGIIEHPYFAVTSAEAPATLRSVPAGEYVVAAWHETLGTREQRVVLDPKASVSLRMAFQAK